MTVLRTLRRRADKIRRRLAFRWNVISEHPLTRASRIRSTVRHYLVLATIRTVPGRVRFRYVNDIRYVGHRDPGIMLNATVGLADFESMGFLLHFLRPGDLFLDVGANVGAYSLLASGVTGARTTAIEPVATTRAHLAQNLELNHLADRVTIEPVAVGDENGEIHFVVDSDAMNRVAEDDTENEQLTLPVRRLDDLLGSATPTFAKFDIEGFELPALRGASRILDDPTFAAVVVELDGRGQAYGHRDEEVDELLRKAGFLPHTYDPLTRRLEPLERFHQLDSDHTRNTLYVRDEELAASRTADGPAFRVLGHTI